MNTSVTGLVRLGHKRESCFVGSLFSIVFLLLIFSLLLDPQPVQAALTSGENPPLGKQRVALQETGEFSELAISAFVTKTNAAAPRQIVGVHVSGVFALPVIQQPEDKPWFVSSKPDTITQFGLASKYESLGFLAHNTLAGSNFYELQIGQEVRVILANGESKRYIVAEMLRYQALDPDSPYSAFRAVVGNGEDLSSTDLFNLIYAIPDRVVFQTCIEHQGNANWGRYFVIAYPVKERFRLFDLLSF